MVAHLTMRTHGVNQAFRFVEGIWLHRKSRQIRFFFGIRPSFRHSCATLNGQPSNIKTMDGVQSVGVRTYREVNSDGSGTARTKEKKYIKHNMLGSERI